MSQPHRRTIGQRLLNIITRKPAKPSHDAFDQLTRRLDTLDERLLVLTGRLQPQAVTASAALPVEQLIQRVEALDQHITALAQQLPVQAHVQSDEQLTALKTAFAGVEKQLTRSGREQLKANALVEAQQEQLRTALETLAEAQEQASVREAAARLEVAQRILPALDGLDEALRAGAALLNQPVAADRPATLFERLLLASPPPPAREDQRLRAALHAWLHGLTFVRQRLLDALAAEQVRPIVALDLPFDPMQHIALQVVPASDDTVPGTVVTELRRGYTIGNRVLRHAEVAVAQEQARTTQG